MHARILVTGAMIAAVFLGATAWAVGSGDISSPQTIHLVSVIKQATQVDLGRSGPSLGDQQVASGTLLSRGRQVGRFSFVCTRTGIHSRYTNEHCVGSGRIRGSQITLDGLSRTDQLRHIWAVTGGTGIYRNVRGEMFINDLNNRESTETVKLIP
jgi:hypothetical protein